MRHPPGAETDDVSGKMKLAENMTPDRSVERAGDRAELPQRHRREANPVCCECALYGSNRVVVRGIKAREHRLLALARGSPGRVSAATGSRRECDRNQHPTSKETRSHRRGKRRIAMSMRQARSPGPVLLDDPGRVRAGVV